METMLGAHQGRSKDKRNMTEGERTRGSRECVQGAERKSGDVSGSEAKREKEE